MLQHSSQLRHLSARVLSVCVMQNTADTRQLQVSNLVDFSCPWHLQHNHGPTRLARTPHVGRCQFQVFMSTSLGDLVPAKYRANCFSRVHEASCLVASSPSHKHLSRIARHSDQVDK